MLSVQEDSYNRQISKQQIQKFYKIFKQLLLNNQKNQSIQNKSNPLSASNEQTNQTINSNPIASNLSETIYSQSLTQNPLHKIINIDCLRTRSMNFNQTMKKNLQYLLTYFVKINKIQYKQGLNQIAAPFVVFTEIGIPISQCYQMFEKFFLKFSLNFYYDKEFNSMEMFFRMISIVLRYHCPSLSRYLEVYDIQPQIYALSWLMTLFSSKLSFQMTYLLWSYLIVENDRYLLFFIVVGIILRRRDAIIQTQNSSVFRIVTDMIFKSQEQLREIIKISLVLRKSTPISLTAFFDEKEIFNRSKPIKQSAELVEYINKLNLFLILPKQLSSCRYHDFKYCKQKNCMLCEHNYLTNLDKSQQVLGNSLVKLIQVSNDIKKIRKNIEYVIIDLRKQKVKLNCQKLQKQVYPVNLQFPFQHTQTHFVNTYMQSKQTKHFILLLTTFTYEDFNFSDQDQFKCAEKFIKVLNSCSFPHLGILQGGYTALSIFEQESMIKINMQNNNLNSIKPQISSNKSIQIEQSQILQLQTQLKESDSINLQINLLFQIADMRYSNKLQFFLGIQKSVCLLTDTLLLIIQQKQGFLPFLTYLQHNCSAIPYFFSNFKNISCKIIKVLPVKDIKQIKYKGQKQNQIVLKFISHQSKNTSNNQQQTIRIDSTKDNRLSKQYANKQNENLKRLLLSQSIKQANGINNMQKQNQQNNKQQKLKKLIFVLKDKSILKQMSDSIQKAYKHNLAKRHKKVNQNGVNKNENMEFKKNRPNTYN